MKKKLLMCMLGMAAVSPVLAQRATDHLDRGLVAVKTSAGVFCSWRLPAEEYYDVKYNIYRDGTKLNDQPLATSNYTDKQGTLTSQYSVEAVVRGKVQTRSTSVTPWAKNYLEVKMDHGTLTSTYVPNDACCADVDGDGQVEILLKFDNRSDAANGYKPEGYNKEYALIEVYKLNGKKLWWIDLGPNMGDFQNNENNIVAFDWDRDGKAEAVLRAADGTVIHMADGTTKVIGDASKNYRAAGGSSGQWFIHEGAEYLLYLNGETGQPYQIMDYPLKRLETGETDLNKAWGDGYGHRSTKHFFGAPFLDGKHASIFLARGIYTRHKMIALDVDPATHQLKERWRWNCNTPNSPWYGQGYHNYSIADVDMDGRDEIVYGSMVIDDNGKGLSTTGLGHGDSHHVGDFDPYTWGEEVFACNEDRPQNNFRDATTSKLYYRSTGSRDDGRAIAGNFLDDYPGAQCRSAADPNLIGGASHKALAGAPTSGIATNFRIYWDGDLLDETFNYVNGKNTEGAIYKGGRTSPLATLEGSMTNNDTKGTPCFQGDILGDWREEVIMRTADNNIRIYTTNIETPWRNYSLWHDHQYRNAMVWQMCGYNQTPHVSYFLGQKENITVAPPPLTNTGRTVIADGGTIGAGVNDLHVMTDETADMTVSVSDGAAPYIYTDNAPSWTQGHDDNNNITTETYTHKLTGGAFTGTMRLVKQGEGVLELPSVVETYTGNTDVWNGTLRFNGTLQNSRLWLNRHTTLETTGGKFLKGIQADYNATIKIGAADAAGTLETDSLLLGFGSRLEVDLYSDGLQADQVKARVLKIEKKDWQNGPRYSTPLLKLVKHAAAGEDKLAPGKYLLGEVDKVEGDLNDMVIEGLNAQKTTLSLEDGKLYLTVNDYVVSDVTWNGAETSQWDGEAKNFKDDKTGEPGAFVPGDGVTFDDTADNTDITVVGNVAPKSITFNNNEKAYTLQGDSIVGRGTLTKNGQANVTINNVNHIGATTINKGVLFVSSMANKSGHDYGALGDVNQTVTINNNATLGITANTVTDQPVKVGTDSATVYVNTNVTFTMNRGFNAANSSKAVLTKGGGGVLKMGSDNKLSRLVIKSGTVDASEASGLVQLPSTVELVSGTIYDPGSENSYTTNNVNYVVSGTGVVYAKPRCEYKGSLKGKGRFTIYATGVRNYFEGDWSQFEGTLIPGLSKRGSYNPSFEFKNSKGLGKCTLQLNEGVEFKNNGNTVEVGAISGKGTLSGSGSYIFGQNGDDFIFNTPCNSPIVKRGTGKMDIRTMGIIDGSITVEEGSLANYVLSYKTKLNGTKSVTLKGTSKFLGGSYVNSFLMNDQSALELIKTTTTAAPATFKTDGMLQASAGTMITFKLSSATNYSKLEVGSNLSLGGITVVLDPKYTPKKGDSFQLWTAGKLVSQPKNIQLPQLPEGLYWDTAGLNTATGVLVVTDQASAISTVEANAAADYEVYTIGGVHVGTVRATRQALRQAVRRLGVGAGTYVLRTSGHELKVVVK